MEACALAHDWIIWTADALAHNWLMNSLWKLVRLYMMSTSNVTWMRYMTHCMSLQLTLMDELCLLVCVLLCLFLSWWATSKVVRCWTKRLTYWCVKHKKSRLTASRPQVPQESMCSHYFGTWGVLYDRCDSCPKKLFVKLVLSGLPSGWTCGICLVRSLSLLLNLFDDGCIMTKRAMLCWVKFLHLLPKQMVLSFKKATSGCTLWCQSLW